MNIDNSEEIVTQLFPKNMIEEFRLFVENINGVMDSSESPPNITREIKETSTALDDHKTYVTRDQPSMYKNWFEHIPFHPARYDPESVYSKDITLKDFYSYFANTNSNFVFKTKKKSKWILLDYSNIENTETLMQNYLRGQNHSKFLRDVKFYYYDSLTTLFSDVVDYETFHFIDTRKTNVPEFTDWKKIIHNNDRKMFNTVPIIVLLPVKIDETNKTRVNDLIKKMHEMFVHFLFVVPKTDKNEGAESAAVITYGNFVSPEFFVIPKHCIFFLNHRLIEEMTKFLIIDITSNRMMAEKNNLATKIAVNVLKFQNTESFDEEPFFKSFYKTLKLLLYVNSFSNFLMLNAGGLNYSHLAAVMLFFQKMLYDPNYPLRFEFLSSDFSQFTLHSNYNQSISTAIYITHIDDPDRTVNQFYLRNIVLEYVYKKNENKNGNMAVNLLLLVKTKHNATTIERMKTYIMTNKKIYEWFFHFKCDTDNNSEFVNIPSITTMHEFETYNNSVEELGEKSEYKKALHLLLLVHPLFVYDDEYKLNDRYYEKNYDSFVDIFLT